LKVAKKILLRLPTESGKQTIKKSEKKGEVYTNPPHVGEKGLEKGGPSFLKENHLNKTNKTKKPTYR